MPLLRTSRANAGFFYVPMALLVAACGSSSGDSSSPPPGDDGGAVTDASGGADGSHLGDSGGTTDASGGNHDGGTTADGGTTSGDGSTSEGGQPPDHAIKTVFLIVMENNDWSNIKGSASAPYINGLLTTAAHAENYHQPSGLHPSEPNYIWLEAGNNFGVGSGDADPSTSNSISTTTAATHLVDQLEAANITWKTYVEGIDGTTCPITSSGTYAAKHTPFLFFQDVTNTNSSTAPRCIAHVRPYTELATDIAANTVPQYNFITPNLCDDMHGNGGCTSAQSADEIKAGDTWLSTEVPKIMASSAYTNGGVIFITWDEGEKNGVDDDNPIGMIVLSPLAKVGYANTTTYFDHSSTVKTNEEIFGVSLIQGAADPNASDLSDLFTTFP